ncbi:MAG: hypothetical protein GC152_16330 [Alphaproteobacteria bacterium]|nr:hypothetical protein [Alphaproteobacteria bacterium]
MAVREYRTEEELRRDGDLPASGAFAAAAERATRLFQQRAAKADAAQRTNGPQRADMADDRAAGARTATSAQAESLEVSFADVENDAALTSGGRRLWATLRKSATVVGERAERLRGYATGVDAALDRRRHGDDIAMATGFRLVLAAAFLIIAATMTQRHDAVVGPVLLEENARLMAAGGYGNLGEASASERAAAEARAYERAPDVEGVKAADVLDIAGLFSQFALLAGAAGLAHLLVGFVFGRLSIGPVLNASDAFGDAIADMLTTISRTLEDARARLQDRARNAGDVSRDVSEAHLAAEEAVLLYQEVGFLAENPRSTGGVGRAIDRYRAYLSALRQPTGERWIEFLSIGIVIGVVISTTVIVTAAASSPSGGLVTLGSIFGLEAAPTSSEPAAALPLLFLYPSKALLFFAGVAAFALGGAIGEALSTSFLGGVRRVRLRQSLDAVRGAITSAEAPKAKDIAMHVEALSAIFHERLAGAERAAAHPTSVAASSRSDHRPGVRHDPAAPPSADASAEAPWRAPADGTPRFAPPRFESAPKTWLAGPDGRPVRDLRSSGSVAKRLFSPFGSRKDR